MKQYEAMFIFDPTFATDYKNVEAEIERIMQRAGSEVIVSRKWDERKLAYEIKRRKRGCYVLTFFKAEPSSIVGIERDCALSEDILRVMIVHADDVSRTRMEAMFPEQRASSDDDDRGSDHGDRRPRDRSERKRDLEPAGVAAPTTSSDDDSGGDEKPSDESSD